MNKSRRVAVLMGGPDRERSVSLLSGEQVAQALEANDRFEVVRLVIDKPNAEELRTLLAKADVVVPMLHGPWGEGGPLQAHLESVGLPFVGSRRVAAEAAMNKVKTKEVALELGLQTPPWEVLAPGQTPSLPLPVVVKPVDDGSSYGVEVFRETPPSAQESPGLCERFIAGRELTVAVLADHALPIVEIVPRDGFYDFDAKYERDDTTYVVEPEVGEEVRERLHAESLAICRAIGVRHLARVDWMLDDDGPWFLELNTMPGMTTHSLLPMASAATGLDMPAVCATLVDLALE